jgi:hypothetical protein
MSTSVMSATSKGWRNEDATMRSIIDALRGADPFAGRGELIGSA